MTPESPSANNPQDQLRNADLAELRHSLRTPINHVLGYCEMLIEDASEMRNARALDGLRQIHSASGAILRDIGDALSNREVIHRSELEELCRKIRPRVDRVKGCVQALQSDEEMEVPGEWMEDLERIRSAAESLLGLFGAGQRELSRDSEPARTARPRGSGPRLLVVDDNSTNRNMLRRRLERQGYAVEEASDGSVALDRIATEEFDLVLLDIMMPVMDGFEVLDRMKRHRKMRTVPVVVISALDEVHSVVRAIQMGAEDYVFKPFDPVLLRARIGALLERKRLASELTVQAKMASLGSLTAGIAHEIKNPLNFVMNFAELAADLVADQRKALERYAESAPDGLREIRELTSDLADSIEKIREHGARANSIISSMLAHSRGQAGERSPTDLNGLVREYVRLAFHGMRAQDSTFQVSIEEDFDPAVGTVSVIPQDLSRVFLNVASNALYAIRKKSQEQAPGYQPRLKVSTQKVGPRVEIRIRDNGTGVPKELCDRIFDPFFTTKAAGEGTGLGLSISYEIVVHEHGGALSVDSVEGEYTEITVTIPCEGAARA